MVKVKDISSACTYSCKYVHRGVCAIYKSTIQTQSRIHEYLINEVSISARLLLDCSAKYRPFSNYTGSVPTF